MSSWVPQVSDYGLRPNPTYADIGVFFEYADSGTLFRVGRISEA